MTVSVALAVIVKSPAVFVDVDGILNDQVDQSFAEAGVASLYDELSVFTSTFETPEPESEEVPLMSIGEPCTVSPSFGAVTAMLGATVSTAAVTVTFIIAHLWLPALSVALAVRVTGPELAGI